MIFVLLSFSGAVAADNPESGADKAPVEYRVNIEYLYTSENDWNIDTINPDIRRSITAIEKINLYNFMWRGGPVVKYDLGNTRTLARKIREAWFGCRQGSRGEAVSRWKRDPDNAVGGQNRRARRVRSFAKMIQSSTF